MGVKSTIDLIRADAIRRLVAMRLEIARQRIQTEVETLSNAALEEELEDANDLLAGGSGFDNFTITDEEPTTVPIVGSVRA